jgi:hypothetical protein
MNNMLYSNKRISVLRREIVQLVLLLTLFCSVNGQEIIPEYLLQPDWLEAGDMKSWNKLLDQHKEADKLLIQSNDIYLKITVIESEPVADKKKKQIDKYEKDASELYKKALVLYKDTYYEFYEILNQYINDLAKQHPNYGEMQSYFNEASILYNESVKLETDEERDKFSRANEMLLNSLEQGISILSPGSNNGSINNTPTNEYPTSDEFVLDNELYQKYKDYLSDKSISDPLVIKQLMQFEGDSASFENYKKLWMQYSFSEGLLVDQKQEADKQISDSLVALQTSESKSKSTSEQNISNQNSTAKANNEEYLSQSELTAVSQSTSFIPNDNLIDFRVQIAASKNKLNISQINTIYSGGRSVIELKEGSYFKYQIRGCQLFSDAQKICSNSGVENAFIAAYTGSVNLQLSKAVKDAQELGQEVRKYGSQNKIQPADFSVQLAASRVRLTEDQIRNMYNGEYSVIVVFEEEWYKYQIPVGKDAKKALSVLESCGVNKAFICAYKNGQKQKLYKALNEYKTYTL